jgi:outer membrane lipoprotein-sorting protein
VKAIFILFIFFIPYICQAKSNSNKGNITVSSDAKYYGDDAVPDPLTKTYAKEIAEVEKYLNSYTTFTGLFKQANSSGKISYGKLLIAKPGKIRCEYFKPSPIVLIINDNKITFYDQELDEVSRASSETNALKLLALENISFNSLNLVELEKDKHFLSFSVKEYSKELKQNLIVTFKFFYPEVTLKQLSIFTEGNEIDMIFEQILYDQPLGNKLFYFHKESK